MNIAQFFHKLRVISNVEIVVPLLPEMLGIANHAPRYSLLQRFQRIGKRVLLRFAEPVDTPTQAKARLEWGTLLLWFAKQEVDMLGHDCVSVNVESVTAAHSLQG